MLQLAFPEDRPSPAETGEPIRRLWGLAMWGFGGPLPESLTPTNAPELAHGIGHLPREVTVPMGTTLIAAWLWIAFCVLAFGGRFVRSQRLRIALYLIAPQVVGLSVALGAADSLVSMWGGFDSRFFYPAGSERSGIWTSDRSWVRSSIDRRRGPASLLLAHSGSMSTMSSQTSSVSRIH